MKYLFFLTLAVPAFAFQSVGVSHSCGVGAATVQWHEEALIKLHQNAKSHCGETAFPVQTTSAVIEEAANCIHYTGGAIATAHFNCTSGSGSTLKQVTIAAGVLDIDCVKSQASDPEIGRELSRLMRTKADSDCGIAGAAKIQTETFQRSCQDSVLTGVARYYCIW